MFGGRVIGITDGAVAVAVINAELAPDVALADVNILLLGQVFLVGRREETGHQTLRAKTAAHEIAHLGQRLVDVAVHLFARVIHVGEIGAGDESHVVAILIVELAHQPAGGLVVGPRVFQGPPAQRPGHRRPRPARRKRRPQRLDILRRVAVILVETFVAGAGDLDLVHPNDRVEGENPPTRERSGGRETGFRSLGGEDLANWPRQTGAESSQARSLNESSSFHVLSVDLIFQRLERSLPDPDDHRFRAVGVSDDPLPEIRAGNLGLAADLQAGGRRSAPTSDDEARI